jgi:hypothetical protein
VKREVYFIQTYLRDDEVGDKDTGEGSHDDSGGSQEAHTTRGKAKKATTRKKLVLKGAGAPDLQFGEGPIPSHRRQGCRLRGREGPEKEAAEGSRGEET